MSLRAKILPSSGRSINQTEMKCWNESFLCRNGWYSVCLLGILFTSLLVWQHVLVQELIQTAAPQFWWWCSSSHSVDVLSQPL